MVYALYYRYYIIIIVQTLWQSPGLWWKCWIIRRVVNRLHFKDGLLLFPRDCLCCKGIERQTGSYDCVCSKGIEWPAGSSRWCGLQSLRSSLPTYPLLITSNMSYVQYSTVRRCVCGVGVRISNAFLILVNWPLADGGQTAFGNYTAFLF